MKQEGVRDIHWDLITVRTCPVLLVLIYGMEIQQGITNYILIFVKKHHLYWRKFKNIFYLKIKNKFCATTYAEYQPAIIFSRRQMLISNISLLLRISRFEYKTLFVIKVFLIVIFIILCTVAFIRTTH